MNYQTLDRTHHTTPAPEPGGGIHTIDNDTFGPRVLEGKGAIVVEFMSYSCAYCGALEPVLQEVAATLKAKIAFYRVNIATEQALASSYQIQGTPTLIMFLNGEELSRVEGPEPTVRGILAAVTQPFES